MATREQYKRYVAEFKQLEREFKQSGKIMDDAQMMTKDEYDYMYAAWTQENSGDRKKLTNIPKQIAEKQAYHFTRDHAELIAEAFKKIDPESKISLKEIRMNQTKPVMDMWEVIQAEKEQLMAEQGLSAQAAQEVISTYYFGSV